MLYFWFVWHFELLSSLFVLYSILYPQLKNNIRKIFNKFLRSNHYVLQFGIRAIQLSWLPILWLHLIHLLPIFTQLIFPHKFLLFIFCQIPTIFLFIKFTKKMTSIGKLNLFHVHLLQSMSITLWLQILQSSLGLVKANS